MKFEYSDFYKFIASVGIALISVAVIVPWLFFREPFDLLLKTEDIANLTPLAQSIIQDRQIILQMAINLMPWFSVSVFILGLIIFGIGGMKWFSTTQKIMDRMSELNLKILEQQLASPTTAEVFAQKEEEARAQVGESFVTEGENPVLEKDSVSTFVKNAYMMETKLAEKLRKCFLTTHNILTERRIGAVSYDIVLLSKNSEERDYIFTFKYIRHGFKYNWVRDNVLKAVYANQIYENETNRKSLSVLFVVSLEDIPATTTASYQKRIYDELFSKDVQSLAVFMSEKNFEELDCAGLKKFIQA